MPFEKGHALSQGRPKGSINKRSLEFQQVLAEKNFNVAEALVWCYQEAKEKYDFYHQGVETGRFSPMEDNAPKYLKIASDMAKEMASYSFPKLKAVEHQKTDPLAGMSPEQKLEAMRHAVHKLELELKAGEK
jgi:hypothetical protein